MAHAFAQALTLYKHMNSHTERVKYSHVIQYTTTDARNIIICNLLYIKI